eukprot:257675-Heterocapsa_arctica.AAC.1
MEIVPTMSRVRYPGPRHAVAIAPPIGEMRAQDCAIRVPHVFTAWLRITAWLRNIHTYIHTYIHIYICLVNVRAACEAA